MDYENALKKLNKYVFAFLVTIVCFMVVIGSMQVFWRYVLKSSLYWSEEIMRYLNIWTIFIGISVGIPRNIHVAIEAIISFLKGRAKIVATMLVYILSLLFFILIIVIGIKFTLHGMGQISAAVRLPISLVYISLPIGGILSLIFTIGEIMKYWKEGVVK